MIHRSPGCDTPDRIHPYGNSPSALPTLGPQLLFVDARCSTTPCTTRRGQITPLDVFDQKHAIRLAALTAADLLPVDSIAALQWQTGISSPLRHRSVVYGDVFGAQQGEYECIAGCGNSATTRRNHPVFAQRSY